MEATTTAAAGTLLDRYVELAEQKTLLEARLRTVKDSMAATSAELLDQFANEGVTSKRHAATGRLVHVTRRIWARAAGGNKPAACEALLAAGLGDFVEPSFNTNSLSSYFREQAKQRQEAGQPVTDITDLLPDSLKTAIELTEDHQISVRA